MTTNQRKHPWTPRTAKVSVLLSVEIDGEIYNLAMNPPHVLDARQMSPSGVASHVSMAVYDGISKYWKLLLPRLKDADEKIPPG